MGVSCYQLLVSSKSSESPGVSQVALVIKNPPVNAGDRRDVSSIPELGRSPGGGRVNPLQYSCLENPMDRGAWQVTVHRVPKSWTRLKRIIHACMHKNGNGGPGIKSLIDSENTTILDPMQ